MTPIELHNAFLSEAKIPEDRKGSMIESFDVFYYLNKAQEQWILEKFSGGFELTQDLIDDLRIFYKKDVDIDAFYAGTDAKFGDFEVDYIEFPDDYLHLVSQRSQVAYNYNGIDYTLDTSGRREPEGQYKSDIYFNKWTQSDDIYRLLSDPFNTTKHDNPITDINDQRINIYTNDNFLIQKGIINYIREPKEIDPETDQESELPEIYHREIVQQAVALYSQFSSNPSSNSQEQEQEN